jgi:hypothetical protein
MASRQLHCIARALRCTQVDEYLADKPEWHREFKSEIESHKYQ